MNWTNIILIALIVLILGLAFYKILKDIKSGNKCSSCPYACECKKNLVDD